MHFFVSPKQCLILLPFLLSLPIDTLAFKYDRRAIGSCADDETGEEASTLDAPTSKQAAGLGVEFETAQIRLGSASGDCSPADTTASKGKVIGGRQGTNWQLTTDVLERNILDAEYILNGKTILIGSGDAAKAAAAVAADLAKWDPSEEMNPNSVNIDGAQCNPWMITDPEEAGGSANFLWGPQVTAALPLEAISDLFARNAANQVHALLPKLNGQGKRGRVSQQMVSVTKEFFQSSPNGITSSAVKDDVLGFFSLIMSYAKAARYEDEGQSPKMLTTIMPRTDFTTIFAQVKTAVPGTLYDIVKVLACYKTSGTTVEIDTDYCSGTVQAPITGTKMDGQTFTLTYTETESLKVSDWIKSIESGTFPDALTTLDDKILRGQVGALRGTLENLYGTSTRAVPLFEFRNLQNVKSGDFVTRVESYEQAIIDYHKAHLNVPREITKTFTKYRHIKRDSNDTACEFPVLADDTSSAHLTTTVAKNNTTTHLSTTTAPKISSTTHSFATSVSKSNSTAHLTTNMPNKTSTTPPPTTTKAKMPSCYLQGQDPDEGITTQGCVCDSTTLPLITNTAFTVMSESCSYTAMPSSSVANPITIETEHYTVNCQACTLVGGINEAPTCTSVQGCTTTAAASATPTFAVFLSNNSLPIGDEGNANSGADMRDAVYSKLRALCPDSATSCDSKTTADIDEIPTVVDGGIAFEKLSFTIQDSSYGSTQERDQMLAAAVSTWQQATSKSCQVVEFKDEPDQTASGCGKSPVKRSLPSRLELEQRNASRALLAARAPGIEERVCDNCGPIEEECTYHATICAGPDHINAVLAGKNGAYSNHMNIELGWKLDGDSAFNTFLCEFIIDGLSDAAMALAPELAGPEIFEEIEFQSLCADDEEQGGT